MSARSAFACASSALLAACAAAPAVSPPAPEVLRPGAGERAAFVRHARGVQIYRCDSDGAAFKWVFVAPEAQLFESAGATAVVGTHGAGPFWQAGDASKVVGKVKARSDAPNATADIPWLLLTTIAEGPRGQFSAATSIQRLRTVGGVAPATGCAAAVDAGKQVRVPYAADYVFFTA